MHERAVLADLIREIEAIAAREGATRVVAVRVRVGPMSHMTPVHFAQHFAEAARGTIAEGALCRVEVIDPRDPLAQSILLASVDVE